MSEPIPVVATWKDGHRWWREDQTLAFIDAVRADATEKAAQRVLNTWEAGALLVCEYPHHMLAEAAIAAACGEEQ